MEMETYFNGELFLKKRYRTSLGCEIKERETITTFLQTLVKGNWFQKSFHSKVSESKYTFCMCPFIYILYDCYYRYNFFCLPVPYKTYDLAQSCSAHASLVWLSQSGISSLLSPETGLFEEKKETKSVTSNDKRLQILCN